MGDGAGLCRENCVLVEMGTRVREKWSIEKPQMAKEDSAWYLQPYFRELFELQPPHGMGLCEVHSCAQSTLGKYYC